MHLLSTFKPALLFLGKFLVFYFVGNLLYAFFIESYGEQADPITRAVTHQTAGVLNAIGSDVYGEDVAGIPKVALVRAGETVLNIFEGCNGVNVMIVFVAFLFAFGGRAGKLTAFVAGGLLIIHLCNLLRLALLYALAAEESPSFYYFHKYFFTAILYAVVFGLWALWLYLPHEKRRAEAAG